MYVAKTLSEDPDLEQFRHLHKIGYTSNAPEKRISGAKDDPTFLNAPAVLIDHYEIPAANAKYETALHNFFSEKRLDIWFENGSSPCEWFDVPAEAIAQAIQLIPTKQMVHYRYNPETLKVELA